MLWNLPIAQAIWIRPPRNQLNFDNNNKMEQIINGLAHSLGVSPFPDLVL